MSDTVGFGSDGWLFLVGGSNDALRFYTDEMYFEDSTVQRWTDLLQHRAARCSEMGAQYFHVGAPEKLSVYHRYWPHPLACYDRRPLNAVGAELTRRGCQELLLDPTEHLKSLTGQQLYYKTDTHWNVYGALEVYKLICQKMDLSNDLIYQPDNVGGWNNQLDLGSKISPPVTEFQTYIHSSNTIEKVFENTIVYLRENAQKLGIPLPMHHGSHVILRNITNKYSNKKLVIFGDSFFDCRPSSVTWFLAESFSEVHFLWTGDIDYDYIAAVRPDCVISELAERFMIEVPTDTSSFERTQRHRVEVFFAQEAARRGQDVAPLKKKRIFDCFTFFNELDVLEIRMSEMYEHVDMFVICEARQTFQGIEKPLFFTESKARYAKYADKIKTIIIDKFPETGSAWDREHYQREKLKDVYCHAIDDDIIIVSDVDEILSQETLKLLQNSDGYFQLSMPMYQYYMNLLADTHGWNKPFAFSKYLATDVGDFNVIRVNPDEALNKMGDRARRIENSGWHFTYLGGQQKIVEKLAAYSHTEEWATTMRSEALRLHRQVTIGYVVGNFWHLARYVPIDQSFPRTVVTNQRSLEEAGYIRDIYQAFDEIQKEARALDHENKELSFKFKKLSDLHGNLVSHFAPIAESTQLK